MINFIARNYLRVLPLIVASAVWTLGYIYIYKIQEYGICTARDTYDCWNIIDSLGFPAQQLGYWLLPVSLIALFSPYRFLKHWLIFASIYLLITWVAIANSEEGVGFNNSIEFVAGIFGIGLLTVTVIWLLIYGILAWRRSKKEKTSYRTNS